MSDIMRPIPFSSLMEWILTEYEREGTVFSVSRMPVHADGKAAPIFNEKVEAPFGPAAGPNTQLAQNIIASYVAGARFFELKTVQIMDGEELSACVNKPCITAHDEAYNCEWSTELTVPAAFDEYVKAWVACKVLSQELGLGDPEGFVFNMSVGYDLEGIQSEKIDTYIENMKDARQTKIWKECMDYLFENTFRFEYVDDTFIRSISPRISDSITESTLHGCPPDEIERIAAYLIEKKLLHTYIKCNPTLLGYEFARKRLDALGFNYIAFDDHHFKEDLQWEDAVPMLRRLMDIAKKTGVEFGVKLTNTFPVDVKANELPSEEMYMSGRALYPLTIELAKRISEEFEGKLRISYSGGADALNIKALTDAGIWPVTMATTVLKPGGYNRFAQIATELMDFESEGFESIDAKAVAELSKKAEEDHRYRKCIKPLPERHVKKKLPLIDCFFAPCSEGCPIHQDIPAYLKAMEEGDAEKALSIILERNALPFITGTICPHTCADKCMRNHYEDALAIREVKLLAAKGGYDKVRENLAPYAKDKGDINVAVVGAGPAGLAAASFLSREGAKVTVFEKTDRAGGVVRHVIPGFRIGDDAIDKDISLCEAYGATFVYNRNIDNTSDLFKEGFTHVILAVGAWMEGDSPLKYGDAIDALEFLREVKAAGAKGEAVKGYGSDIVVIGGGNTAMDTARAAKCLPGTANVRLVYRRDRRNMPADEEELIMALEDGVEFMELLSPVGHKDGKLECSVMKLGEPDESGRRAPVDTGEKTFVDADTVIAAVGEKIDQSLFKASGIETDAKGCPVLDENLQTNVKNIFAIGDCKKGPATVVKGIADAIKAEEHILGGAMTGASSSGEENEDAIKAAREKHGSLCAKCSSCCEDKDATDDRCLRCATVCEACVEVCPNRANVSVKVPGLKNMQIIHVDGMCNECGNCGVFCPYDGDPYRDKFTLYRSEEDFENSRNEGFLPAGEDRVKIRLDGKVTEVNMTEASDIPAEIMQLIRTVLTDHSYLMGGAYVHDQR